MNAHQIGPHSFGSHILQGAGLLLDSFLPGRILEFSAPTGSGVYKVLAKTAQMMEGVTYVYRIPAMGEQFARELQAIGGAAQAHACSFRHAAQFIKETAHLCPFVIFSQCIQWDGIARSVAEEFCAHGCIVVRVK